MRFYTHKEPGVHNKWIAESWGKEVKTKAHGTVISNSWKHWAIKKIILLKLNGFIMNRKIAFEAIGKIDTFHSTTINKISSRITYLDDKNPAVIYMAVTELEPELRYLLPFKANKMTDDILSIILYCKIQTENYV